MRHPRLRAEEAHVVRLGVRGGASGRRGLWLERRQAKVRHQSADGKEGVTQLFQQLWAGVLYSEAPMDQTCSDLSIVASGAVLTPCNTRFELTTCIEPCMSVLTLLAHSQRRRYMVQHQAKEIARLNGVYNKLLKEAGVTMYGAQPPA